MEKNNLTYEDILVEVDSREINNNNIQDFGPYTFSELDGSEFKLPKIEKGTPQCELCFRKFQKFSQLYSHQGKFCLEDTTGIESHLVKVNFKSTQLPFIQDCLPGLKKEVKKNEDGTLYVEQEAAFVAIFLQQLYTAQVTKYNLEEWYPSLFALNSKFTRPVTSPTVFLPLSDDELQMMRGLASANLARAMGMDRRETNKELALREKLEERLAEVMDPTKVHFCRMSTRSPKDAVSLSAEEKLLPITERVQRKIRLLQVRTPQQVVDLLAKSQRVFSDINFYFGHRVANSSSARLFLILREWTEIPQDHEFRCYVIDRKIVAISQYQCYCAFPAMQNEEHVRRIRDAIMKFHDQITQSLPMHDYVIDIAVFEDLSCSVIELNPMGAAMSSGSALFNWIKDADLLTGKLNLELPPIRVLKRLIDEDTGTKIN